MATNALSPFAAQIVTKVLMMGYLIVQYRLLGGGQLGNYLIAALLFTYTSTIADWGLSTLVTRDVARSRGEDDEEKQVASLFRRTLALRLILGVALFVPTGVFIAVYSTFFELSTSGAWATALLALSLIPGAFSASVTSVLYAYERMSLPAAIGIGTSLLNVVLGVLALFLGFGVIGLAGAALLTTLFTALFFTRVLTHDFPRLVHAVRAEPLRLPRPEATHLLKAGWPLMLNALLVGLFFRIDQFIIEPVKGSLAVEQYGAAYSFLNFVLLITPAVTLALFPRMSRHAATDRPRLAYEYGFALKVLLVLSVPIMAFTVWFAPLLISVVTGWKPGYLPDASQALQILIFFLPFSFINGLTQYVLIALDRQTLITRAFGLTLVFNIAANLLLVPMLGIGGAALTTILSELVLLGPFLMWTGREIGAVPLAGIASKPLLAGIIVAGVGWLLRGLVDRWSASWLDFALYVGVGVLLLAIYGAIMLAVRPFGEAERATLGRAFRLK